MHAFTSTKSKIYDKSTDFGSFWFLEVFNAVYPNVWLFEYSNYEVILISDTNPISRAWLALDETKHENVLDLNVHPFKLQYILGSTFYTVKQNHKTFPEIHKMFFKIPKMIYEIHNRFCVIHKIFPETNKHVTWNAQNNLKSPQHILSNTTMVKYDKYFVKYTKYPKIQKPFREIYKTLQMKYAKCFKNYAKFFVQYKNPFHLRSQTCDIFSTMPLCSD